MQKYAHIGLKQNPFRSTTLDIITRLLDNAAFVCVHVVGRSSKDFSEVLGLRSRGFQLQVEWMTTIACLSILLATFNYRARGTCGLSTLHCSLNQSALKHGRRTFLYSAMGELVCSRQLWARTALKQLHSYKVE